MPEFVRVGRIVGAFGLRGQVKVEPLTDFLDRFAKGSRLRLRGDWIEIENVREHKGRPLLKLKGIDKLEAAQALQWEYLEAVDVLPELEEDEFLVSDLEGMKVVSVDGRELGTVDKVLAYPAQDILQVGELLIPLVKQFIKSVDVEARMITVELIPGMLPGEDL